MIKRLLFTLALMGLLVIFMEPVGSVIANLLHLEKPMEHNIVQGDWLSKLALKYYGDSSYWRELALVNRAPNADLIFPKEEIIIPSFGVIQQIRKSRSLSAVNELFIEQERILAQKMKQQADPLAKNAEQTKPSSEPELGEAGSDQSTEHSRTAFETSHKSVAKEDGKTSTNGEGSSNFFSSPLSIGLTVIGILLVFGIFLYRHIKKQEEEVSYYGSTSYEEEEDSYDNDKERSPYYFDREPETESSKTGESKRGRTKESNVA